LEKLGEFVRADAVMGPAACSHSTLLADYQIHPSRLDSHFCRTLEALLSPMLFYKGSLKRAPSVGVERV
jgi:hypothetical protein